MVLTQHILTIPGVSGTTMFPYHYGSHATIEDNTVAHDFIFNVSIPLWFSRNSSDSVTEIKSNTEFPYHYGSHATSYFIIYNYILYVSIPLWFSRNVKSKGLAYHVFGFHTTMVLTQQNYTQKTEQPITCFHTTMVLTQRRYFDTGKLNVTRFHTTMVLTQRIQLRHYILAK